MQPHHLTLLAIAIAAAFLSRACVLFWILPLFSALRLSQKVSAAYKLAITWGGLRGAVTLALALAVTENASIDGATKDFVAVLATCFVLFTLLGNGLTLRPIIRLLRLDRLSPLDQSVRSKVLALSLADVRDLLRRTAHDYRIPPAAARAATRSYEQRIEELAGRPDIEDTISDRDRLKIGLVALTNRERRIVLDHHDQASVSPVAIERLLHNTNFILDAARSEGPGGYNRAANELLQFSRGFRLAHLLHRTLRLDAPLQREVSIRFETLLTRRLALEELAGFVRQRLRTLLGEAVAGQLDEMVAARAESTARALDALRLQYPEHAEALERRFLQQSGQRLLMSRYGDLLEEGLIGGELFDALSRDRSARPEANRLPPLDLGLRTEEMIGSFEMFAGLEPAELKALVRLFRPRLLVPEETIIRKGERGRSMFFISSGAVEVVLPQQRVRLGSGEFVGEMALLNRRRRQADVVSLGYGRALELGATEFRRFLSQYPRAKAEIERVARVRTEEDERLEA
jgi:CPA1 family monovalent cation:H+ antiporter